MQDIQHGHRQRWQWLRSELALQNAINAIRRSVCGVRKTAIAEEILAVRPDLAEQAAAMTIPLEAALVPLHAARMEVEGVLRWQARQLPVWPWVEAIRGFGDLGLAQIVGETGDLSAYANPAKVWKRLGLGVLEDGTRQRLIAGITATRALEIGYVPRRRSVIAVIGSSLMQGNRTGEYRSYFVSEKERQRGKLPDATKDHVNSRALRHMEKRLIRDLWRAWKRADGEDPGPGWTASE